jgi:multiple sugar transport system ATP-binding protein
MVSARIAGAMAVVRLSPEDPVARGMDLSLQFDLMKLHVFDAATGDRIETVSTS